MSAYPYTFPVSFPLLSRYTKLSEYAIDDIINGQVTITNIGEFNDIFDGAIHAFHSKEEMDSLAEQECNEVTSILESCGVFLPSKYHEESVKHKKFVFEQQRRGDFHSLDYLGAFVCCFSAKSNSTLMWSHYAGYNTGMCVTYDFNQWTDDEDLRYFVLPVAYTDKPIIIPDKNQKTDECEHPIIANILCTALCKAKIWQYENEWRLIFLNPLESNRRMSLTLKTKPISVCFGYHFMKTFFCSENKKNIENFNKLLLYLIDNDIQTSIITPEIGGYKLISKNIEAEKLQSFINKEIKNKAKYLQSMRFYYVLQNRLLNMLEK